MTYWLWWVVHTISQDYQDLTDQSPRGGGLGRIAIQAVLHLLPTTHLGIHQNATRKYAVIASLTCTGSLGSQNQQLLSFHLNRNFFIPLLMALIGR